jgi:GAF domain-containing protein
VGDDGGAQFYRGQIEKNTATVGLAYFNHTLPGDVTEEQVLELIATLNADAAEQYRTAQRFRERALQALAERNFVYAQTLAEKAATIAADLVKRLP